MNKKNFYISIAVLLIVGSCFLYFKGHLLKIFFPEEYYISCTDYGQYITEVKDYLNENKNFTELINVGSDPGFYIIVSIFLKITNIHVQSILPLASMFMYCINGLCIFIIGAQASSKKTINKKYIIGLLSIILYISLYGTVESYISGIWRQVMGNLFFLVFLIARNYPNTRGYLIVGVISAVMSIMTHRIFILICSVSFIFIIIQSFFANKEMFKKNISLFALVICLVAPYFGLFFNYVMHLLEYNQNLKLSGEGVRGEFTIQKEASKYLGWSFYGPRDNRTALMHYIFHQSYVFIIFVSLFRKSLKKTHTLYAFLVIFLLVYLSIKFSFGMRILLTFEIIIIPILWKSLFLNRDSALFKILMIIGIFFLGFSTLSKGLLKRAQVKHIDSSISFLLEIANITDRSYFFTSSACGADLMGQLGLNNFFDYQMPLLGMRESKSKNIPDVGELQGLTSRSIVFLKRNNTLFDFFQDKGRLFIIFIKSDKKEVELIRTNQSDLLGKDYLRLIYPSDYTKPGRGIIQYIFEIDTKKLQYTDSKEYIKANIQNLNLEIDT